MKSERGKLEVAIKQIENVDLSAPSALRTIQKA
jgi:hypothetical protein